MAVAALDIALLLLALLGAAWGTIVVHEGGHYLMAFSFGVPAGSRRLRMERPPHVALRQGDRWLSPDDPQYASAFAQHNPSMFAAWMFVAGGVLVETVLMLFIAALCRGFGSLSLVIVGASTALLLMYLVADVALSLQRRRPYGDFGAMFTIARGPTVVTIMVVLLVRTVAIFLLV